MGNALSSKGDLEGAIECYNQAIRIKPNYAEGHCNLGAVLQLLNHSEPAQASYEKAISLKKDFNEAISGFGLLLLKKGKHSEGLDKLIQGEGSILFSIKRGFSVKSGGKE
jgi:tetratricopeptide (TPR) repeat protein